MPKLSFAAILRLGLHLLRSAINLKIMKVLIYCTPIHPSWDCIMAPIQLDMLGTKAAQALSHVLCRPLKNVLSFTISAALITSNHSPEQRIFSAGN